MIIKTTFFRLLTLSLLGVIFNACENPTTVDQAQFISEVSWKTDGSGMLSFVQRFNASLYSSFPAEEYSLYHVGADGSLGDVFATPEKAIVDFSFAIFHSADGKSATMQLGNNVYRIDIATGAVTELIGFFHLIAASPDNKYIVGSHSPAVQPRKTITVYDVSVSPARPVKAFDYTNIANTRGVIFANNTFGITINDSTGSNTTNITIFDTTGKALDTIGNAAIISHNFVYHSATNSIFFRDAAKDLVKVDLSTGARATMVPAEVSNFDVTADERFLIYNKMIGSKLQMIKFEVALGSETLLTDDILWGVFLSPKEDKVAYIRAASTNFHEIKVIGFSK